MVMMGYDNHASPAPVITVIMARPPVVRGADDSSPAGSVGQRRTHDLRDRPELLLSEDLG